MGLRYNPFSGNFDFTRSPGSYLDGEVATYADLPLDTAAAPLNSAWLVAAGSGLWLLTRKPAGIYIRTATGGTDRDADYTYAGTFPDVFSDANFVVYNDADSTKNVKLDASALTTGTTRTLTVPNASGTLPLLETANTFSQNQTLNGTNNVAPNQTAASGSSVMTRDLGDARYRRTYTATRTTNLALNDTNYVVGLTFPDVPAGNYYLQGLLPTYGGNNSSGVKRRIIGNTATITGRRGYYANHLNAFVFTSNIASEVQLASGPVTGVYPIYGSIIVSVAGSIDVEFAQNTSQPTPSQLQAEAHLILTELP